MALNFTVSYTFSPSTTISSSQVNTNFSDIASVFQGLEAETKTLAKLKMDIDPTLALEVATKQYVDHYAGYRRPNLQYSSTTVVNIETGINGTSGQAQILFPDGNLRQDSTTTRINCNLAQVAALSGTQQSGLRTGTVANNTWYAIYAVKTTDDTTKFVTVADVVLPIQTNFSTLSSNFGTSGWVYLGLARYGDQSNTASAIVKFVQAGNMTRFYNVNAGGGNEANSNGLLFATSASSASLSITYSAGTSGATIPSNILMLSYGIEHGNGTHAVTISPQTSGTCRLIRYPTGASGAMGFCTPFLNAADGITMTDATGATTVDIYISGFVDGVLGVGSNPLL